MAVVVQWADFPLFIIGPFAPVTIGEINDTRDQDWWQEILTGFYGFNNYSEDNE